MSQSGRISGRCQPDSGDSVCRKTSKTCDEVSLRNSGTQVEFWECTQADDEVKYRPSCHLLETAKLLSTGGKITVAEGPLTCCCVLNCAWRSWSWACCCRICDTRAGQAAHQSVDKGRTPGLAPPWAYFNCLHSVGGVSKQELLQTACP